MDLVVTSFHLICVYHSHISLFGWLVSPVSDVFQCDCAMQLSAMLSDMPQCDCVMQLSAMLSDMPHCDCVMQL